MACVASSSVSCPRMRAPSHQRRSGGAESLDKTRRWLLDSGARIPDQVADLIRVPRPERHRTILLGGVRRKLLGVVPAPAGTQSSAAERWSRVARQNPAVVTGFRRSDPGSSRRLDPGPSAGTTSSHSPRWRASQAPRCRARACGHPVISGGAVVPSRTARWRNPAMISWEADISPTALPPRSIPSPSASPGRRTCW